MRLEFKAEHLSIERFDPVEMGDFAVITGINGSGKTHLLRAIRNGSVSADSIRTDDIVFFDLELLACGSAMRMYHLSVTLSVEFADADTALKAHYRPDTDNRSDNWCITRFNYPHANTHLVSCQGVLTQPASLLCLCFTEAKLPQCSSLAPYNDVSNTKGNLSEIG